MFLDFAAWKTEVIVIVAVLLAAGIAALLLYRRKHAQPQQRSALSVQMLVHGALCIAVAFVLSYLRLFRFPQGGSITPASMLPLILFSYLYGTVPGAVCSVGYGLLQLLQDFYVMHPVQLALDYLLAFGVLSIAGLFSRRRGGLIWGTVAAGLARFLCHLVSGVVFFGSYAIEQGQTPFLYSLVYNAAYVLPDMAICLGITLVPGVRSAADRLRSRYRPLKKAA